MTAPRTRRPPRARRIHPPSRINSIGVPQVATVGISFLRRARILPLSSITVNLNGPVIFLAGQAGSSPVAASRRVHS